MLKDKAPGRLSQSLRKVAVARDARDGFSNCARITGRDKQAILLMPEQLRRPQAADARQDDGRSAGHRLKRHTITGRLVDVFERHNNRERPLVE